MFKPIGSPVKAIFEAVSKARDQRYLNRIPEPEQTLDGDAFLGVIDGQPLTHAEFNRAMTEQFAANRRRKEPTVTRRPVRGRV